MGRNTNKSITCLSIVFLALDKWRLKVVALAAEEFVVNGAF
jgi:hypothetical protein